jgi:hypothetical protein
LPVQSGRQTHTYFLPRVLQVPPFWQGSLSHGSPPVAAKRIKQFIHFIINHFPNQQFFHKLIATEQQLTITVITATISFLAPLVFHLIVSNSNYILQLEPILKFILSAMLHLFFNLFIGLKLNRASNINFFPSLTKHSTFTYTHPFISHSASIIITNKITTNPLTVIMSCILYGYHLRVSQLTPVQPTRHSQT